MHHLHSRFHAIRCLLGRVFGFGLHGRSRFLLLWLLIKACNICHVDCVCPTQRKMPLTLRSSKCAVGRFLLLRRRLLLLLLRLLFWADCNTCCQSTYRPGVCSTGFSGAVHLQREIWEMLLGSLAEQRRLQSRNKRRYNWDHFKRMST